MSEAKIIPFRDYERPDRSKHIVRKVSDPMKFCGELVNSCVWPYRAMPKPDFDAMQRIISDDLTMSRADPELIESDSGDCA